MIIAEGAPAVEAPVTEGEVKAAPAVEVKKEDPISPRLGLLAKKERAIFERQKRVAAQSAEIQQKLSDWENSKSQWEAKEKLWKEDPFKALEAYGHNYQGLTEKLISGGELTAKDVQKEVEALKQERASEREQMEKQRVEQSKAQETEAVNSYKEDLRGFVTAKTDKFPLMNLFGDAAIQESFDSIAQIFEEKGVVIDHEQVCAGMEKYYRGILEEAVGAMGMELVKKGAIAAKAAPAPTSNPMENAARRLTNDIPSSAIPSVLPSRTENDRIRRAMAALDGKR